MNFDPNIEAQYQNWQQRRDDQDDSEAREWDNCKTDLTYALDTFGWERVTAFIQDYRIANALPAPQPRPTTFNGVSID